MVFLEILGPGGAKAGFERISKAGCKENRPDLERGLFRDSGPGGGNAGFERICKAGCKETRPDLQRGLFY